MPALPVPPHHSAAVGEGSRSSGDGPSAAAPPPAAAPAAAAAAPAAARGRAFHTPHPTRLASPCLQIFAFYMNRLRVFGCVLLGFEGGAWILARSAETQRRAGTLCHSTRRSHPTRINRMAASPGSASSRWCSPWAVRGCTPMCSPSRECTTTRPPPRRCALQLCWASFGGSAVPEQGCLTSPS